MTRQKQIEHKEPKRDQYKHKTEEDSPMQSAILSGWLTHGWPQDVPEGVLRDRPFVWHTCFLQSLWLILPIERGSSDEGKGDGGVRQHF